MSSRRQPRRLLGVGNTDATRRLRESFLQSAPRNWDWLGVVDDRAVEAEVGPWLGTQGELQRLVFNYRPTDIVVCQELPTLTAAKALLQLRAGGVRLVGFTALHEEMTERALLGSEAQAWEVAMRALSCRRWWFDVTKRMLDLVAGVSGLAVLGLVVLPVALGLKLERAGSVFVRERRVGFLGQRFTLLRLRTARDAVGPQRWPFVDPPPPLRTGSLIRRLGVERLPQALAVLAGHLSLVGPRAAEQEVHERLERESPIFLLRTAAKPGLVGWEQVHRESRAIFDSLRPLEYDFYYVKHQSLVLDLRILASAALTLLGARRRGLP